MVLSAIYQFAFNMPPEIVFGRIVPGIAIAILAGVVVYTILARQAAVAVATIPHISSFLMLKCGSLMNAQGIPVPRI